MREVLLVREDGSYWHRLYPWIIPSLPAMVKSVQVAWQANPSLIAMNGIMAIITPVVIMLMTRECTVPTMEGTPTVTPIQRTTLNTGRTKGSKEVLRSVM